MNSMALYGQIKYSGRERLDELAWGGYSCGAGRRRGGKGDLCGCEAKGCEDAVLVYPSALAELVNVKVGATRVNSLAFPLDGDPGHAGRGSVGRLLATISRSPAGTAAFLGEERFSTE